MLENKKCVPCQGGIPPLKKEEIEKLLNQVDADWNVKMNKELYNIYNFDKYSTAIKFSNLVADLSEDQGHHPYIHINFKSVKIILFKHKIDGLHENDFLMAKKIDIIYSKL